MTRTHKEYCASRAYLENTCKGSKTNRLLDMFNKKMARYRQYSVSVEFMKRLDKYARASFDQSGFLNNLRNIFQTTGNFLMKNIARSRILNTTGEIMRGSPGESAGKYGAALTVIIITNALLSFYLHKPITLFGGAMRSIFLVLGLVLLSCRTTWRELRQGSFFLRSRIC